MKDARRRPWFCCQIGAREHYAVARALHSASSLAVGGLGGLITESWVPPGHPLGWKLSLRERYHSALANAPVHTWNYATLAFELAARARGLSGWPLMLQRNQWFQQRALRVLAEHAEQLSREAEVRPALFAYSYAARELLRFGKQRGWLAVLGQIDPGPVMEQRAKTLVEQYGAGAKAMNAIPKEYWDSWREECALADCIVVNSQWSQDALVSTGIPLKKITVIPLAFTPSPAATQFERQYPASFTKERPLRVLLLGQVTLLKGILPLLAAAQLLANKPVEFLIVGARHVDLPQQLLNHPQIKWIGAVPRSETASYYRQADVFVFPSFSDGFGLTQLEAQAWKLPVIASRFCGDVVQDGVNGLLLNELTGEAIADILLDLRRNPRKLRDMSAHSGVADKFSLNSVGSSLFNL